MNPFEYPDDELIIRWTGQYGTTGVKFYQLDMHAANEGCIAAYRELSMQERMLLGRLEELESASPGAFDIARMLVSTALLYPTVDAFPAPVFAVGELFPVIRQHGHGPLDEKEPLRGKLPEHMATDIRNARRAAQLAFEDEHYTSIYKDLVMMLATREGTPDPHLLFTLWQETPGRLRDLLAVVEQTNNLIFVELAQQKGVDRQRLAQALASPFNILDQESDGATVPGFSDTPPSREEAAPRAALPATNLPPNRPPLTSELERALEG